MHKWKSMHNSLIRHHQLLVGTSVKSRDWLGNWRKHIQKIDCNFRNSHFTSLLANRTTQQVHRKYRLLCATTHRMWYFSIAKKIPKSRLHAVCMTTWQAAKCPVRKLPPLPLWGGGCIGFSRRRQKFSVNRWKYVKKETRYCLYWFMRLSNCDHFSNSYFQIRSIMAAGLSQFDAISHSILTMTRE